MFMQNSFGRTIELLQRAMSVTVYRRGVIADNVANSDTPGFKRSVVNFETELARAFESEGQRKIPALLSDPRHIPFDRVTDWRDVRPRKVLDYTTSSKNNGNNVDLEEELMLELQNQLNYDLYTGAIANQFSQINLVVK